MKKHNISKVVLITILVFLLLSWILPAAYYSGQYVEQGRVQMGLYELFNYPLTAISYFGYIALFIIFVGGFYGILYKIPAYRTFLDKIVRLFAGKEKIFIAVVSILLAAGVSICGLQIGYALFIPFIVSLILLMGYDKIVAAITVVGSMAAGLAGSTFSSTNLNVVTSSLSLDIKYQIGVRFVILIVGIVLVLYNLFFYMKKNNKEVKIEVKASNVDDTKISATKTKNATSKKVSTAKKASTKKTTSSVKKKTNTKTRKNANKAALKDDGIIVVKESVLNTNNEEEYLIPSRAESSHSIWPFAVGFVLLFILLIIGFISWGEGGFGITLFEDVTKSVSEFEIFKFPIFSKIYGTMNAFGTWTLVDLFLPVGLLTTLLVIIYKVKIDDIFDGFIEGAKKALGPAFISILVYTCLVLVTYHPFQLVIYKALLGISKGFNMVTTIIVFVLSSLFNGDISYVAQSTIPYYTSVVTNTDFYPLVGIIFQSIYGLTSLFVPTSLILMATLSYLNISYKEWLKNIWKLLLELFVILLIIFIILALI